jgi:hypothetical protein
MAYQTACNIEGIKIFLNLAGKLCPFWIFEAEETIFDSIFPENCPSDSLIE